MNTVTIVKGNGNCSAYEVVKAAGYEFLPLSEDPHHETFQKDGILYRFAHPVWVWNGRESSQIRDVRIVAISQEATNA